MKIKMSKIVIVLIALVASVNAGASYTACGNVTMLRFADDKCTKIYVPKERRRKV